MARTLFFFARRALLRQPINRRCGQMHLQHSAPKKKESDYRRFFASAPGGLGPGPPPDALQQNPGGRTPQVQRLILWSGQTERPVFRRLRETRQDVEVRDASLPAAPSDVLLVRSSSPKRTRCALGRPQKQAFGLRGVPAQLYGCWLDAGGITGIAAT